MGRSTPPTRGDATLFNRLLTIDLLNRTGYVDRTPTVNGWKVLLQLNRARVVRQWGLLVVRDSLGGFLRAPQPCLRGAPAKRAIRPALPGPVRGPHRHLSAPARFNGLPQKSTSPLKRAGDHREGGGLLTGPKTPGLTALRERPLKRPGGASPGNHLVITAHSVTYETPA